MLLGSLQRHDHQRPAERSRHRPTKSCEGFGLTVTEAMWKGKLVIGGNTGGYGCNSSIPHRVPGRYPRRSGHAYPLPADERHRITQIGRMRASWSGAISTHPSSTRYCTHGGANTWERGSHRVRLGGAAPPGQGAPPRTKDEPWLQTSERLIVVSNRLPYVLEKHSHDQWTLKPGSGGLVTALLPVLRDRGGIWIGWSGATEDVPGAGEIFRNASREAGYLLKPVSLSQEEVDRYYHGYSNESIWPLFHDLQSRCEFDPEYWHAYVRVNRKFAEALAAECCKDDFVWVHDYQLMDVHHYSDGGSANLAFFLHIPPAPDIFMSRPSGIMCSLPAFLRSDRLHPA